MTEKPRTRKNKARTKRACQPRQQSHLICSNEKPCLKCTNRGKPNECIEQQHLQEGMRGQRESSSVYSANGPKPTHKAQEADEGEFEGSLPNGANWLKLMHSTRAQKRPLLEEKDVLGDSLRNGGSGFESMQGCQEIEPQGNSLLKVESFEQTQRFMAESITGEPFEPTSNIALWPSLSGFPSELSVISASVEIDNTTNVWTLRTPNCTAETYLPPLALVYNDIIYTPTVSFTNSWVSEAPVFWPASADLPLYGTPTRRPTSDLALPHPAEGAF